MGFEVDAQVVLVAQLLVADETGGIELRVGRRLDGSGGQRLVAVGAQREQIGLRLGADQRHSAGGRCRCCCRLPLILFDVELQLGMILGRDVGRWPGLRVVVHLRRLLGGSRRDCCTIKWWLATIELTLAESAGVTSRGALDHRQLRGEVCHGRGSESYW